MRRICFNSSSLPLAAFLLIFVVVGSVQAQSGRRVPKGSTTPVPTETPAEQEKPAPQKPKPVPQISLLVASNTMQSLYLSIPFPERVPAWVAKRLRDSSLLAVMEGERMNRKEAIKHAKAATDVFVVFLQLEESGFSSPTSSTSSSSLDNVSISYTIFSPVTGQAKSSGVVYLNQRSSTIGIGQIRVGLSCYPDVRGNDYILLQASLEVANRIMSSLNIPTPPLCS